MRSSAASYVTRELELRLLPARDALPYMPFDVWRPDGDCILRGYVRGVYWRGRQRANCDRERSVLQYAIDFATVGGRFILLAAEFSPLCLTKLVTKLYVFISPIGTYPAVEP